MSIRKKIVFLPYDFDTSLGINNEGSLVFSYNLEDIDQVGSDANVYNGQNSVLWKNLRAAFFNDLRSMYQTLRSTGALSYAKVEQAFEEHQNKWGEAIFNEDAWFKYLAPLVDDGDGSYLAMLQGSKAEQRKWWLYNRFRYIDSKYNAGDSLTDYIQLRGYAKANVSVTPYADIYATVKFGSYLVQDRAPRNIAKTLVCPLDSLNDTEIYIYSSSQISSVGDLSGLKVGFADFSRATKLQSIKLGDNTSGYSNTRLDTLYVGNNVLLKSIDVRNCTSLGTGDMKAVDLSGCTNIENVYFDGTSITGVDLPNGGVLKVLHLPSTITNLTIKNQNGITDFTMPDYSIVTTLWLENVNGEVDSKTMIGDIPANSRVRLIGISWEADDAEEISDLLDTLDTMRGLDEQGRNVESAQVSGTIHTNALTGAQIAAFNARYPNITVTATHITSYLNYYNYDGSTLLYTESILDGGNGAYSGTSTRAATAQYTYTFAGWSTQTDQYTVEPSATQHVVADRNVYAVFTRTVNTYTVTWENYDGTVLRTDTNVAYGTDPSWGQAMPTKDGQTAQGWTPALAPITGNTTYTATYLPTYTVYFYNGSTLLQTVQNVVQGSSATYTGSTPHHGGDDDADYVFNGWSPAPTNIQENTSCYAQYDYIGLVETITDTWDEIIEHINDGTYATRYSIGDTKTLNLGTEGKVNMQIVAFNTDTLAYASGTAPITFISEQVLKTDHRMNPAKVTGQEGTGSIGGWGKSEMRSYLKNTIKPLIPSNVRSAIVEVNKYTRIFNTSENAVANDLTQDDVWIPSNREIFGGTVRETSGVSYSTSFPDNTSRTKQKTGSSYTSEWWLRTAYVATEFLSIENGSANNDCLSGYDRGVVLGFCLGKTYDDRQISDSWDTIISNINNGTASKKYTIGNYKDLTFTCGKKISMQLVGFDKDALSDDSGMAKTTWLCKNTIEYIANKESILPYECELNDTFSNNTIGTGTIGGWPNSKYRTFLSSTLKNQIPSNILNNIKQVKKYSTGYNTSGQKVLNMVSDDYIWAPSIRELNYQSTEPKFNKYDNYDKDGHCETMGPIYDIAFSKYQRRLIWMYGYGTNYGESHPVCRTAFTKEKFAVVSTTGDRTNPDDVLNGLFTAYSATTNDGECYYVGFCI